MCHRRFSRCQAFGLFHFLSFQIQLRLFGALVRANAMGAIAPVDFEKEAQIAPVDRG
jgi:hypothetical protein